MARKHLFQGSPKKSTGIRALISNHLWRCSCFRGVFQKNPGIRVCIASYGEQSVSQKAQELGSQDVRDISFRKGNKESTKSECGLCYVAMEKGSIFFFVFLGSLNRLVCFCLFKHRKELRRKGRRSEAESTISATNINKRMGNGLFPLHDNAKCLVVFQHFISAI